MQKLSGFSARKCRTAGHRLFGTSMQKTHSVSELRGLLYFISPLLEKNMYNFNDFPYISALVNDKMGFSRLEPNTSNR